jgi:DNA-binding winged helix-turn-helix (wHTH) protein
MRQSFQFGPFRLDVPNQCLWHKDSLGAEERITLTPKAFAILQCFAERPGELVTQDDLLDAVWGDTHVQPDVLKRHIVDVRKILGDSPKEPRVTRHLG